MVKIQDANGVIHESNSLNSLVHQIMNDTMQRNADRCKITLAQKGFKLETLQDDGKHARRGNSPKAPTDAVIYNQLLSITRNVDAVELKALQEEFQAFTMSADYMKPETIKTLNAMRNKIEATKNPIITIESLIQRATDIINKFHQVNEEQAIPSEPTEPSKKSK